MELKLTGLSKKTKAELIDTVKVLQEAYQELKTLFAEEKEKFDDFKAEADAKANKYKETLAELQKLKTQPVTTEPAADVEFLSELKAILFDNEPNGQLLIDDQYVIQAANQPALEKLCIATPDSLVEQKILDLVDDENGKKLKKKIDKVFQEKGKEKLKKIKFKSRDGAEVKTKGKIKPIQFKSLPAALIQLE